MSDEASGGKSLFQKIRMYSTIGVIVLAVVVILQNTRPVDTYLLFREYKVPLAALLGAAVLIGFAGGVIWSEIRRRRKR